ncbi:sodium-coupled monocarboxylate transporter 1-like [Mya arenaria]|uniref:sodium-coupled monocarboxylate transporter 1-like n=1 Tax=Mya arenaria TaxID=6604 RepID=UPI0022E621D3|nr:sodium-coupled monocarboxylate transporter 1-like [Mya arenaria]
MASEFTVVDYVVFAATILISLSIGILFAVLDRRRKTNTPEDYFLAGRKSPTVPVMLSFIVTFQSSVMYLGFPAEGYVNGMMYGFYGLAKLITLLFTAYFIVPVFHPLKLTTVYQYLNLRYGNNALRILAMVFGSVFQVFYFGTVTYGTCIALEVVMGVPYWATIVIYTGVTTLYTSIGGIKAVIWTDVFQFVVMCAGFVAVMAKTSYEVGGMSNIVEHAGDRFTHTDFRFDPRIRFSFWNVTFGSLTLSLYYSYTQSAMQRVFATPTTKTARRMYLLSVPLYSFLQVLPVIEGVFIFAYYAYKRCDIYGNGTVKNVNEILPYAITDIFQNMPGLPGLFISALSSAAFSTLSSCLSSLSAIVYEDIIKVYNPQIDPSTSTTISRFVTVGFGAVGMGVSFLITSLPGSVISLFQSTMACMDGPTCAIFLLSAMFHRATTKGVLTGALCGAAVALWLNIGKLLSGLPSDPKLPNGPMDNCSIAFTTPFFGNMSLSLNDSFTTLSPSTNNSEVELSALDEIYRTSFILFSLIGFLVALVVGVIVSLFTSPPQDFDKRCLFSFRKHIVEELFGGNTEKVELVTMQDLKTE